MPKKQKSIKFRLTNKFPIIKLTGKKQNKKFTRWLELIFILFNLLIDII